MDPGNDKLIFGESADPFGTFTDFKTLYDTYLHDQEQLKIPKMNTTFFDFT